MGLLEQLTQCILGSPTIALCTLERLRTPGTAQEYTRLVLKAWKVPGEWQSN